jgi:hypothetical protein
VSIRGGEDGDGNGDGSALVPVETLDDLVLDLAQEIDLSTFGDPFVDGVSCPSTASSESGVKVECAVMLSDDPQASMTVALAEDGALEWCTFSSGGEFVLNLQAVAGPCAGADSLPPVVSSTTEAPAVDASVGNAQVSDSIETSLGPATIGDIRFTDRYPAGCQPADPACANSTGNRIVVFLLHAPAGTGSDRLMERTDEFFASRIVDEAGGVAFAKSISVIDDLTVEVVYDQITVDNPRSLTLEWPGTSSISLPL